jgi:subtilisin family serine protease
VPFPSLSNGREKEQYMSESNADKSLGERPHLDETSPDARAARFPPSGGPVQISWEPGLVEVQIREGVLPEIAVSQADEGAAEPIVSAEGVDLSQLNGLLRREGLVGVESSFQRSADEAQAAQAAAEDSGTRLPSLLNFLTLRFPANADTVRIAGELSALGEVERAVPVPTAIPPQAPLSEPLVGNSDQVVKDPQTGLDNQWYVFRCKADQAWANSSADGVVIADIDWGYRVTHEDLEPQLDMTRAYNSYDGGTDVSQGPAIFHGTGVMGLAGAAVNGRGMAGFAYRSNLWPIQADSGPGNFLGGDAWARAIDWVRTADSGNRRKIIVLEVQTGSFGNYEMVPSVNIAIRTAIASGVVVCVAAGNGDRDAGVDDQGNPIPETGSILVGATAYHATQNPRAWFSNFGPRIVVSAPGDPDHDLTCGSSSGNAYTNEFGGTSGATPKVAAAAALMLAKKPTLTHAQVREILSETGSAVVTDQGKPVGTFLDCHAAIRKVSEPDAGWKQNLNVRLVFQLCSDAANSGRKVHAYIDANGQISSAQLA